MVTIIDWEKIPKGYNYVAVDANGWMYAYSEYPLITAGGWWTVGGNHLFVQVTDSKNWRESLQSRPGLIYT